MRPSFSSPETTLQTRRRYEERNRVLLCLGYRSYRDYLQSRLWARIRLKALRLHGFKCLGCQDRATEVHHFSYQRHVLEGRSLGDLFCVCRKCHEYGEFDNKGRRQTPRGALKRIRERFGTQYEQQGRRWCRVATQQLSTKTENASPCGISTYDNFKKTP